ncbi:Flp pilus assembly protein TadD [Kineococcus xinjiangensis]|uniref:Flp pilus assembly protein TadD n=1 Tax=Kineococcus xinjiangensis TaxID=512762 RepID=A0A2S6INV2_9ACTN|nr:tetratricopeptide repeat protein [Kineococcus xinjiangensis]PPK95942.1 Flp pilus assembly protein TadD [Kineococcus xinjiangensis]
MNTLVRRLALAGGTLGLGLALFTVGSVALGDDEPARAPGGGGEVARVSTARPGPLQALQSRVERLPGDWVAWAALGSAYVEQARVSGDAGLYLQAEKAFAESLRVQPEDNAKALTGQAGLAAARHDFTAAVDLARRSLEINAYDASAYGVLTDGLVELGRYEEAEVALQRMADLNPDGSVLTRVSYLRELRGDGAGARAALEQARDMAHSPAGAAFAAFYLGELAFNSGDLDTAEARYGEAAALDPGWLPPVAGSAKVAAARGDVERAEADYRRVLEALPLPQYASEFGDLLAATGRTEDAQEQYAVVEAQIQLIEANGGRADLEAALFAADHGDPAKALELAQAEHRVRQTIHTEDALAWALHLNGRHAEALPHAENALRLGTRSASFHFHKGMIEAALHLDDRARESLRTALAINPHFSLLQAPTARAELARLGVPG